MLDIESLPHTALPCASLRWSERSGRTYGSSTLRKELRFSYWLMLAASLSSAGAEVLRVRCNLLSCLQTGGACGGRRAGDGRQKGRDWESWVLSIAGARDLKSMGAQVCLSAARQQCTEHDLLHALTLQLAMELLCSARLSSGSAIQQPYFKLLLVVCLVPPLSDSLCTNVLLVAARRRNPVRINAYTLVDAAEICVTCAVLPPACVLPTRGRGLYTFAKKKKAPGSCAQNLTSKIAWPSARWQATSCINL
jgi:hypothetical protein